jgi:hypothetical protein
MIIYIFSTLSPPPLGAASHKTRPASFVFLLSNLISDGRDV